MKTYIKKVMQKIGLDIVRYDCQSHARARRAKLLGTYGITLVFDVGANVGQFAQGLRDVGYKGRIVSFEPLSSAYHHLTKRADQDSAWIGLKMALGNVDGEIQLNVAGRSGSSSIREMLPSLIQIEPRSQFIAHERVRIRRLESIFGEYYVPADNVYLKVDTQGFEKEVIEGAGESLDRVDTLQLEMSLVPLYKGEMMFIDMVSWLNEKGYLLVSLEPAFTDRISGQVLQVDGTFHRFRDSAPYGRRAA